MRKRWLRRPSENPLCVNPQTEASIFPILSSVLSGKSFLTRTGGLLSALDFDTRFDAILRRRRSASGWNTPPHRQQSRPVHLSRHQQLHRRARHAGGDRSRAGRRRPFRRALEAIGGRPVSHIFVSHTHRDHSPLAGTAQGRDRRIDCRGRSAPPCPPAEDRRDQPARRQRRHRLPARYRARRRRASSMADDWTIRTVLTPGHTANHAAFALEGHRHPVLGRPCDGLVDLDRRAAGRRDGRLHGLARQAARARRHGCFCPAMAVR